MGIYKLIIYLGYLLMISAGGFAQGKDMFIEQIQDKTISREKFNSAGKLDSKQEFVAGKMVQSRNSLIIKLEARLFDEKNNLKSSYTTTYQCLKEESNVLLSVFSINSRKQKIEVSVTSGDFKNMYRLNPDKFSKAISLRMDIESGILNFLGSKNYVTIDNRSQSQTNNQITINSAVTIKTYLLGIRIRTIKYRVTEYLTTSGLLQRQIFRQNDGSYFTMNYQ